LSECIDSGKGRLVAVSALRVSEWHWQLFSRTIHYVNENLLLLPPLQGNVLLRQSSRQEKVTPDPVLRVNCAVTVGMVAAALGGARRIIATL
jgi:hypothetical protein